VVKEVGKVLEIKENENNYSTVNYNTVAVEFPNIGSFWIPEKAMKRLIPWLPVDSVVQVSNGTDV
jgi:hypothetical protein